MSKEKIYDLLAQLAVIYGKEETIERLQYYSIELSEYDYKTVETAIRLHAKTKNFFPSLSEIIEAVVKIESPSMDPTEVAQKLIDSTYKFGEYRAQDAKENLGELWVIVEKWGGWKRLCTFSPEQIPTIRAQLRDLIDGINRKSKFQIAAVGITQIEFKNELKKIDFKSII